MPKVSERINNLEKAMEKLIYLHQETQEEIRELAEEMGEFKDGMKMFKDEMLDFKNEMRDFKDGMKMFKDEMLDFKNEMRDFKDEMLDFKEWTRQSIKDLNKKWGELANRLGTVVEDIIAPGLLEASEKYFNCERDPDDFMIRRRKKSVKDHSKVREFDLIIVCSDDVIVNETKTNPKPEYVEAFYEFIKSGEFFDYFPEFRDKNIIPVFSSLNLSQDIVNLLTKKGIYAATMKGEYIDLVNFDNIQRRS